ncbi:hypothetical protein WK04_01140 [Burkholderia ubonensis]|nr:hypothetical protein WK04_01140 [Burkholderia ubonensis]
MSIPVDNAENLIKSIQFLCLILLNRVLNNGKRIRITLFAKNHNVRGWKPLQISQPIKVIWFGY